MHCSLSVRITRSSRLKTPLPYSKALLSPEIVEMKAKSGASPNSVATRGFEHLVSIRGSLTARVRWDRGRILQHLGLEEVSKETSYFSTYYRYNLINAFNFPRKRLAEPAQKTVVW